MNRKVKRNELLLVTTGFGCNNSCAMCSVRDLKKKGDSVSSTDEIVRELRMGIGRGYEKVDFTGGEPTIREDIFFLINAARKLGYTQIGISTNGRMLADKEFCAHLVENGLNQVSVSVHGHSGKLHDSITRSPGSFAKATQGIQNILRYPGVATLVCTAVMELNHRYLSRIGSLVHTLGVSNWNIADLLPSGQAEKNYASLAVHSLTELSRQIHLTEKIAEIPTRMIFYGFPPCVFSPRLRHMANVHFITTEDKQRIFKQVVGSPRVYKKEHVAACADCAFSDSCDGIWKDYLRLRGTRKVDKEAELLVSRNTCYRKVKTRHI